jgi:hypothetical protein
MRWGRTQRQPQNETFGSEPLHPPTTKLPIGGKLPSAKSVSVKSAPRPTKEWMKSRESVPWVLGCPRRPFIDSQT